MSQTRAVHTHMWKELELLACRQQTVLKSDVRAPIALGFGCSFCCCLANALKYCRAQVDVKQGVRQSVSEKTSVRVAQTPGQLAAVVLPPVPANSFQLESDFRQLRSSPEMLYQYVKVSWGAGGTPQCSGRRSESSLGGFSSATPPFCVAQVRKCLPCWVCIVLDSELCVKFRA